MGYENGIPIYHKIKFHNVYYDNNPKYIKDLSKWLNFFNKKVPEGLGQPNDGIDYDIEMEYVIPYSLLKFIFFP